MHYADNKITKQTNNIPILSGWTAVPAVGMRGEFIEHDAEATPLKILTDSAVGSGHRLWVTFYQEDGTGLGGVDIKLTDPPQYQIGHCTDDINFTVPEGQVTWTITKTDVSISISANDDELLTLLFSESTRSECVSQWSRDVASIQFNSQDTASQMYRAQPSAGRG